MIVGIDANAPEHDPPDWDRVRYWWSDEADLLGPSAIAKDAYRRWLAEHPDEFEAVARARPQGPLACTHIRGGHTPSRYDHVLVTDRVEVDRVTHHAEQAFAAGSDHALVTADLHLPCAAHA